MTGLSSRVKCVNCGRFCNGSKSANSVTLFDVSTNVVRLGTEEDNVGWICLMRFRARKRVWRRGKKGKFPRREMELSVKSIASWSYLLLIKNCRAGEKKPTFAIPKFSIAGILCPTRLKTQKRYQSSSFQSVVSVLSRMVINAPRRSSSRSLIGLM